MSKHLFNRLVATLFTVLLINIYSLNAESLKGQTTVDYVTDSQIYYNVTYTNNPKQFKKYWVDMERDIYKSKRHRWKGNIHHCEQARSHLKFNFPFYGGRTNNITIAKEGYLYLGDTVFVSFKFTLSYRFLICYLFKINNKRHGLVKPSILLLLWPILIFQLIQILLFIT